MMDFIKLVEAEPFSSESVSHSLQKQIAQINSLLGNSIVYLLMEIHKEPL